MESNDSTQEEQTKKKGFFYNPVAMGWIGLISLGLTVAGLFYTYLLDKSARPAYAVLSDEVWTDNPLTSRITVFYDTVEVKNVRALSIVIWNAGNEFLPKESISKASPISIRSTKPVSILEFNVVKTTRPNLKFKSVRYVDDVIGTPIDTTSKSYDYLSLEIDGDEGLEAGDGAKFIILYTTASDCEWCVDGRVKGIPEGIARGIRDRNTGHPDFILLLIGVSFFMFFVPEIVSKLPHGRIIVIVTSSVAAIISLGIAVYQTYWTYTILVPPDVLQLTP